MYRGVYLNLSRSNERRTSLLRHLEETGAASRYERMEAIDGRTVEQCHETRLDPGNLGLWLSHEKLLQTIGDSSPEHIHLIEDDTLLSQGGVPAIDAALACIDAQHADWDLLFTDVFVQPCTAIFVIFDRYLKNFAQTQCVSLLNLAQLGMACTSSMLINKSSVQKYASLISGQWQQGVAIDMYIRDLVVQGKLQAFVTMPFLTSVASTSVHSDIRGNADRSRRVCDILRSSFFIDADVPGLLGEIQALTAGSKISSRVAVFLQAEMFMLGDQWTAF